MFLSILSQWTISFAIVCFLDDLIYLIECVIVGSHQIVSYKFALFTSLNYLARNRSKLIQAFGRLDFLLINSKFFRCHYDVQIFIRVDIFALLGRLVVRKLGGAPGQEVLGRVGFRLLCTVL
jgi:hypothetical protein